MKNFLLLFSLIVLGMMNANGQASADSIRMQKTFGGYAFYQGSQKLKMKQLVKAMEPNETASQEIQIARSTYNFASVLGGVGGALVGFPIGTALGGGEPNWTMAAIGAGLILVSVPISQTFNRQARQAVNTFNGGLRSDAFWADKELRFAVMPQGLGLRLRF